MNQQGFGDPPFIVCRRDFVKLVFTRITAAILMVASLSACGTSSDSAEQNGTVEVLSPQPDSGSSYALKFVKLLGIDSLETVSGKFVQFFMSPRMADNKLHGRPPVGRFIKNSEGQFIPSNDLTQQLVTVYSHIQKLAELDNELGAEGVNQWPREIGVGVRVLGGMNNNAFYDGKTDAMLFVPYNKENLNIAINGGILAHEHFHSLFYKLVLKDQGLSGAGVHDRSAYIMSEDSAAELLSDTKKTVQNFRGVDSNEDPVFAAYHLALIRAINEGMADYWGWMYTGDPDFIAQSLPAARATRSLKAQNQRSVSQLPQAIGLRRNVEVLYSMAEKTLFDEQITNYAYTLASQFSRVLKRYSDISAQSRNRDSIDARKETGKLIVKMLPLLKRDFFTENKEYYTSLDFVNALIEVQPELNQQECEYLGNVMQNTNDDSSKSYVCAQSAEGWKVSATKAESSEQVEVVELERRTK